jgi:hypothetical protein
LSKKCSLQIAAEHTQRVYKRNRKDFSTAKGKVSMKEADKNLESLIGTVTKSKLPDWVKNTVVVSAGITPLLQVVVPLILVKLIADLLLKLLGF